MKLKGFFEEQSSQETMPSKRDRKTVKEFEQALLAKKNGKPTDEFKEMEFIDEDFSKLDLSNITIIDSTFRNIRFDQTFDKTRLIGCTFIACQFKDVRGHVAFDHSQFVDSSFSSCTIPGCSFIACTFTNTNMSSCNLNAANFSLSNYTDLSIRQCKIEDTLLSQIAVDKQEETSRSRVLMLTMVESCRNIMQHVAEHMSDPHKAASIVERCDEIITDMQERMKLTKLKQIPHTELARMLDNYGRKVNTPIITEDYEKLSMQGHDFSGFDFDQRNISGIDFAGSDFSKAVLAGCVCTGCDFTGVDFTGAIFFKAQFHQCIFAGAKLDDVIWDRENRMKFIEAGLIDTIEDEEEVDYV